MDRIRSVKIPSVIKIVSKYYSSLINQRGLWLFIAVIFFNPLPVGAQSSVSFSEDRVISRLPLFYEVTAEAEAIANNFVSARKKAVKSAMKIAVQDAIESILGNESDSTDSNILRKILSRPKRYVKSYRFLSAYDNTSLMLAEIRLEVEIYVQELKQKLRSIGALTTPAEDRTVAILILETGVSSSDKSFWDTIPISEIALVQRFQEAGIQAINRNSIRDLISEEVAIKAAEGDIASAVDVGYRSGTDVVIVGKAISSRPQEEDGETQASVTLKAISSSRGTLIAARSVFASALEEDPIRSEFLAFDQATSKISKFLIDSVQEFWTSKLNKSPKEQNLSNKNSISKSNPQAPASDVPSMFGDL